QPTVNPQRRWLFIAVYHCTTARSGTCKLGLNPPTVAQQRLQGSFECIATHTGYPHPQWPASGNRWPLGQLVKHTGDVLGFPDSALQHLAPIAETPLDTAVCGINFQDHRCSP